jgi:gallate decarboxylase subunit D
MIPRHIELSINASAGRGRHMVHGTVQLLGNDVVLSIRGGSMPHIGSVCITHPRPGLQNHNKISCTSSVYNFIGHKDEAIARNCAEKIAAACSRKTVAVAGIHIDNASSFNIAAILKNVDTLCAKIIKQLRALK